jgi:hypothetical protein
MSALGTLRNWRHRKNRSRSGDSRHSPTCRRLDPIEIDPKLTGSDVRASPRISERPRKNLCGYAAAGGPNQVVSAGVVFGASAAIGATLVATRYDARSPTRQSTDGRCRCRRRPAMVRLLIDRHVLQAPMLGASILQHETARFSRTLGTLLRAMSLVKRRHRRWTIILL